MKETNNTDPIYTFDLIVNVRLFNCTVPKSFHDYIWDMASRNIKKMGPGSDISIGSILDPGTYEYLGKEGLIAAEKCLEHWAMMGYLSLSLDEKMVNGEVMCTVN